MAFTNQNICRSFNQTVSALVHLSAQDCTEVVIYNQGAVPVYVYDNGYAGDDNSFIVAPSAMQTFRGVTNSSSLSAETASGSALIFYRTQYYFDHVIR